MSRRGPPRPFRIAPSHRRVTFELVLFSFGRLLFDIMSRRGVWLMRQAGRYLPEYRSIRERAGGFLDLCFNPELAAEVTLQPVRRFGFDAAILFSDILIVPLALGRKVEFLAGEGPKLDPLDDAAGIATLRASVDQDVLAPVYETVRRVTSVLDHKTAFIGFCGAPWTVERSRGMQSRIDRHDRSSDGRHGRQPET